MSTSELACTYAALILHGDGITVMAEKISALVNAAGLTVESYWPSLFAKLASKRNIDDLVLNVGSASVAAPATAAAPLSAASSAGNAAAAAPTPVEKKEEVMEESEDDMVFGLFD